MGGLQKEFFHMIVEAVFDPGKCHLPFNYHVAFTFVICAHYNRLIKS